MPQMNVDLRRRSTGSPSAYSPGLSTTPPSWYSWPFASTTGTDAVESDGAFRPQAFDLPLVFQLHAELGEERDGGVQVFDDDAWMGAAGECRVTALVISDHVCENS